MIEKVMRDAWGRRAGEMAAGERELAKLPPDFYAGVSLREIGRLGADRWLRRARGARRRYDPLGEVLP
jgi:hypothetical protein